MSRMGRNPFEEKPQRKKASIEVSHESIPATQIKDSATQVIASAANVIQNLKLSPNSFQKLQLQFDVDQFAESIFEGKFSRPIKTVANLLGHLKRSTESKT